MGIVEIYAWVHHIQIAVYAQSKVLRNYAGECLQQKLTELALIHTCSAWSIFHHAGQSLMKKLNYLLGLYQQMVQLFFCTSKHDR